MSGIISESFINKWPRLGRAHLRLQNVFLGWAPKLPDSGTIMGSFHATLCIYFTAFLCLLSLHSHLENIFGSCRSRHTEIVECFMFRGSVCWGRGTPLPLLSPPPFSPSCPCAPSSPASPSSLPSAFFLFLFLNNHKKKNNHKDIIPHYVLVNIFIGNFWLISKHPDGEVGYFFMR